MPPEGGKAEGGKASPPAYCKMQIANCKIFRPPLQSESRSVSGCGISDLWCVGEDFIHLVPPVYPPAGLLGVSDAQFMDAVKYKCAEFLSGNAAGQAPCLCRGVFDCFFLSFLHHLYAFRGWSSFSVWFYYFAGSIIPHSISTRNYRPANGFSAGPYKSVSANTSLLRYL